MNKIPVCWLGHNFFNVSITLLKMRCCIGVNTRLPGQSGSVIVEYALVLSLLGIGAGLSLAVTFQTIAQNTATKQAQILQGGTPPAFIPPPSP